MKMLLNLSRWFVLLLLAAGCYFVGGLAWSYRFGDRAPKDAPMGEKIDKDEDLYTAQIVASAIDLSMSSRRKLMEASKKEKLDEAWQRHGKQWTATGKQPDPSDISGTALNDHGDRITDPKKAPGFSTSDYRRDVHAKSHGCAYGKFQVLPDVPGQLAFGLLSHPGKTYRAIVRFSSGKPQLNPDGVPDARGFAMKLLMNGQGLPADPARPLQDFVRDEQARDIASDQQQPPVAATNASQTAQPQASAQVGEAVPSSAPPDTLTQDFVMINSKVFFIRTIEEYEAFSSSLGSGKVMQYFFPSPIRPWTWHAREMALAISSFKPRPQSLVTEQYYSLSAYKLGPRAYVKYSMRPCSGNTPRYPTYAKEPGLLSLVWRDIRLPAARAAEFSLDPDSYRDYLRDELTNQLRKGNPCFDLLIQPQIPEKDMPIEDATEEWSETASPFITVGRLTLDEVGNNNKDELPDNNTAEINQVCENLSFNPWHALPDHEPVGVMNRVRKAVYQGMSRYRRTKNCQQQRGMACPVPPPDKPL
jgi:Catalase